MPPAAASTLLTAPRIMPMAPRVSTWSGLANCQPMPPPRISSAPTTASSGWCAGGGVSMGVRAERRTDQTASAASPKLAATRWTLPAPPKSTKPWPNSRLRPRALSQPPPCTQLPASG